MASGKAIAVAVCPWCDTAAKLAIRSDGMGTEALVCDACGCKGPSIPIHDNFADADERAIRRWSTRRHMELAIPDDILARLQRSLNLHSLLGGSVAEEDEVPVRIGDIIRMITPPEEFGVTAFRLSGAQFSAE